MKILFEVGDVVRLVSTRPAGWNKGGLMDKFLNSVQVVQVVRDSQVIFTDPATQGWLFTPTDIIGLAEKSEPILKASTFELIVRALEKYPVGTKFLSAMSGKRFTSKGLFYAQVEDGFTNILDKGANYVYYRGTWAALQEKSLMFNEHKVKYNASSNVLSVGCRNIYADDIEILVDFADQYNITTIIVDGSIEVPTSTLKVWLDLINKHA